MERFGDSASMRAWSRAQRGAGRRVAFVPTMGFLHDGHLSLVEEALRRADVVVTSIYVNPTQFAPHEDFDVYPRDLAGDLDKLRGLGCHAVFTPDQLYPSGQAEHETWVQPGPTADSLCGASRPGFFRGVTTVVAKLFHIVEPDVAVFGKKDYQQWRVISTMVRDLDMPVEIVGMPIVRESDGLALSSRNARLSREHREAAVAVPQSLALAAECIANGERSPDLVTEAMRKHLGLSGGLVDYIALVDAEHLRPVAPLRGMILAAVAVNYGDVRLIDNREIPAPDPAAEA